MAVYPGPDAYLAEITARLQNPSVPAPDLLGYISAAARDVNPGLYSQPDFDQQILDMVCFRLAVDNKFPEISSVSSQGVTTSFSQNDPGRFRRLVAARRQAAWMP